MGESQPICLLKIEPSPEGKFMRFENCVNLKTNWTMLRVWDWIEDDFSLWWAIDRETKARSGL